MEEASHGCVTQFLRRHCVRILIGAVLVVAAFAMLNIYSLHLREQRIAKEIQSVGGRVEFKYRGPNWISQSVRDRIYFFDRISLVDLHDGALSSDLYSELGSLTNLESLNLNNTHVTDANLERLQGLTDLTELYLFKSQVTDAGLEHLKGFTKLTELGLGKTQITGLGLEHLRGLINIALLDLHASQVRDADLGHLKGLTKLTALGLDSTQVTDAGLEHLQGLTNLTTLFLSTQTTEEGRAKLQNALPNCKIEQNP